MTNDKILEILSSDLNPSASTISRYKDAIDWDDVKNLIDEDVVEEKVAS